MINLPKPQAIIFDWDNTLAENRNVVVSAMNKTLEKYGKENWEITKKKYRDPNKSLKENFENFFGENEKKAYQDYLIFYIEFKDMLKPVKNSQNFLKMLAKKYQDIKLIIVSNKERSLLLMEIEALFKDINFYKIMGNGDSKKNKPDPSPVFKALKNSKTEINPENVWIIGDSKQDIDCAYNSNCQPILIGEGKLAEKEYFEEKTKANPKMIQIGDFAELIEYFSL